MTMIGMGVPFVRPWIVLLFIIHTAAVQAQETSGRVSRPYSLSLTAKGHSTGHSPFSGNYYNHHPNLELALSYKKKRVGAFVSRGIDLSDTRSGLNYANVGVSFAAVQGRSIKVIPYVGYVLKQSRSFCDRGSDFWSAVVVSLKVGPHLTLENTALFSNLVQGNNSSTVANRTNLTLALGKWKMDIYGWYTHGFHQEAPHYVSTSLAVTSPEWNMSHWLRGKVQVAGLHQVAAVRPEGSMKRGILFSVIVQADFTSRSAQPKSKS